MRRMIGLALAGMLVLSACGSDDQTSEEACAAAEDYLSLLRDGPGGRPDLGGLGEAVEAKEQAEARLREEAPRRATEAMETISEVESDTLRTSDRERRVEAFETLSEWMSEDCDLSLS